ncbi:hypothetical protein BGZ83_012061, partial [Gryganskiella cystojenkinii]
ALILSDPESPARRIYFNSVQELVIQHPLPFSHVQECNVVDAVQDQKTPQTVIERPVFPNLKRLTRWFFSSKVPLATTLRLDSDLLGMIQLHAQLESVETELLELDSATFDLLCEIVEHHPSLKRLHLLTKYFHYSSRPLQRLLWSARRMETLILQTKEDNSRSYRDILDDPTRLEPDDDVQIVYGVDDHNEEDIVQFSQPPRPTTAVRHQIRSLEISHVPSFDFWIYLPVLQLCANLEKLVLTTDGIEGILPSLTHCLHSSCPKLSSLQIKQPVSASRPMDYTLDLLCDPHSHRKDLRLLMPPLTIIDINWFNTTVAPPHQHSEDCSGFHLDTFILWDGRPSPPLNPLPTEALLPHQLDEMSNRSWSGLVYHHGATLRRLDVTGIRMPLREFSDLVSQLPGLADLRGCTTWYPSRYLRTDGLSTSMTEMGLSSWHCPDLTSLDFRIDLGPGDKDAIAQHRHELEAHAGQSFEWRQEEDAGEKEQEKDGLEETKRIYNFEPELLHMQYLFNEIRQCQKLSQLTIDMTGPWPSLFSLSGPYGGLLRRLSTLNELTSVCWRDEAELKVTKGEADWILEHWPKLSNIFSGMQWQSSSANRAVLEYLKEKKPSLTIR